MITNNNPTVAHMTTNALRACHFDFQESCSIVLEDGSVLPIEKILRILPGKRMVALAEYKQEKVVAKIFFSKKEAAKHAKREQEGVNHLLKMKIPSPELIVTLLNQEKNCYILIFRYLNDADNLYTLWEESHSLDVLYPILQQVTQELATQHVLGVMQRDLHFKNFMITPHKVFTLDGAQLSIFPQKLDKKISMQHLALFLSQMGVGFEAIQQELFLFYVKLRGWLMKGHELHDMFLYIREANRTRWQRHQKKIFRHSSQFAVIQQGSLSGICDRTSVPANLRLLLEKPEQFFTEMMPHQLLKAGRSATVVQVSIDGQAWVIKRYNIKHFFHRIKRWFTSSRAKKSWYHAQKLMLFSVHIPKPVAFLEKRQFGFKTESYFISEYVAGMPLSSIDFESNDNESNQQLINNIVALLKKIVRLEWTHGDLKASNILVANNKPLLIDFDGAKEHQSETRLQRETVKDWKRFLKNFSKAPTIKEIFSKALFTKE